MKHLFISKITVAISLLLLLFSLSSHAKEGIKTWNIKDLVQIPAKKVELRDKRDKVVKTVDITQMIYIYAVMIAIEDVAEINATLFILEGKEPNAFATLGKDDENVIGISFGMLDLLGNDVHATAAIIGHELAHLKLNHIEERKETQKKTPQTTFTAASSKYTRDNERESDYLGVIWAIEAGYDPYGAVRVHEHLYKLAKRSPHSFVGSHPSSIERITILKSLVRRLSR